MDIHTVVVMLPLDEPLIAAHSQFTSPTGVPIPAYANAPSYTIVDLENNGVPRGVNANLLGPAVVTAYLHSLGYTGPNEMHGVCAMDNLGGVIFQERLVAGGVGFHCLYLTRRVPNAADREIRRMIEAWATANGPPANIFLIGSHHFYARQLQELSDDGFNILLAVIQARAAGDMLVLPATICHSRSACGSTYLIFLHGLLF